MAAIPGSGALRGRDGSSWPAARALVLPYMELGKARLSVLVLLTTAVGYVSATGATTAWLGLAATLIGTGLSALGANALNQCLEIRRDALMARTRSRPLPTGRLGRHEAFAFGLLAGVGGPLLLAAYVNRLAALLALTAVLLYTLAYTPLKARTSLSTLIGAAVGAVPPLIGWVAAAGTLDAGGWILGGVLFLWQVPHSLSLAWMHRTDYVHAGFRVLPAVDPAGHLTGCVVVIYTLVLVPLTVTPTFAGLCGWTYALGALLLGGLFLAASVALERQRTRAAARRLFLAGLLYLPLLLGLMLVDRQVRS